MSLDTYANLKSEIAEWLDRDDLTDRIDTFIDLAEDRHKREIRIREMVKRSQSSFSERFLSLPSDFLEMQTLRLIGSPVDIVYELSLHELNLRRRSNTGTPEYYAIHGDHIEFDRTPDSTITAEMVYWAEPGALSDANTSNVILDKAPSLYLYGALVAAEPFLMNDERIKTWDSLYVNARDALLASDRAARHGGPLTSRVYGATP